MSLDELTKDIPRIIAKYQLIDIHFDTERAHELGDLSSLLKMVVDRILPNQGIQIKEVVSSDEKFFIATLSNQKGAFTLLAYADDDWLSNDFFSGLEELPLYFGSEKRLCSINPAIGLTEREAWYFYGTEHQLKAAKLEGLPLIFPGEDFTETE